MGDQDGRTVLYRSWFFVPAGELLEEVGPLSTATGFKTEKEHPCFLLAGRSGERHSFAPEHRAEFAVVFHRPPRTWARILFQGLYATGSTLFASTRGRSRLS